MFILGSILIYEYFHLMKSSELRHFSDYQQQKASRARSTEAELQNAIKSIHVRNYEALYVLDCTQMEIVYKSENFENVTGLKSKLIKRADLFYHDHLSLETLNGISSNMEKRVHIIYETDLWTDKDLHQEVFKLANGRCILKSSFIFMRDELGITTHSASFVRDVTGIVSKEYRHQFIGPNEKELNATVNNMTEFVKVLSKREIEILLLIGKGYSSRQIGEIIHISKHTVDTHRRNILNKLESTNSIEALKKADGMGLLINT